MNMKLREKLTEVFNELADRTEDGCVTPEMLVNASKPADAPLHDNFEWDNEKAGHSFRVWQARQMLSTMTLEVDGRQVREFENLVVRVDDTKTQGYYHIDKILENKNLKEAVVEQVQRELRAMLDKYERYEKIYTALKTAKRKIEAASQYITE